MILNAKQDVMIDSLQGVANLKSFKEIKVNIGSAETVKLNFDAPMSQIEVYLRSLHDSSVLKCKSLVLTVPENFKAANIYNTREDKYELEVSPELPTLFV